MEFGHYSVLKQECIENLKLKKNGVYLDGTLGGGGHSKEILKLTSPDGKLIAIDKDSDAISFTAELLKEYLPRITFVNDDFKNVSRNIDKYAPEGLDGILLDLGVSSYQIDNESRGFSYKNADAPLDMRMDKDQYLTAFNVVNEYKEYDLARIIYEYGEERFSRRIAANIVKARERTSIRTSGQLSKIIEASIPAPARFSGGNPCKKTFQAIRIEVNGELKELDVAITNLALKLKRGGRMCVISFHSLEDRIVKNVFRELNKSCACDPRAPICTCNKKQEIEIITNKPVIPGEKELTENKRSASAKLRVIERI